MLKGSPERDKRIEKAIKFLVFAIEKSGSNPKPVILHSIRVGLYLYEKGYRENIVMAGLLHDLLEDSDATFEEIKQNFGSNIANLVQANSFDKDIKDKGKRKEQTLKRCLEMGKDALIIKAADILDNSYYYHLAEGEDLKKLLFDKMEQFIEKSSDILKDEIVWKNLSRQYIELGQVNFRAKTNAGAMRKRLQELSPQENFIPGGVRTKFLTQSFKGKLDNFI